MSSHKDKIALVLGSGGARGLAHIGVLKAIEENHIPISMISGTSIGALVGGLYASGINIKTLEDIVRDVDKIMVAKILIPKLFSSGFIDNQRVIDFLNKLINNTKIEDLKIPFATVATDLITGEEVVFNKGPLVDAIIASIAIPTIFQPVYLKNRFLIDGGLCNPLPISVAKNMGANKIIAVNVSPNPTRITKKIKTKRTEEIKLLVKKLPAMFSNLLAENKEQSSQSYSKNDIEHLSSPSILNVFLQSISISTNNLMMHHLRYAKPDVLISPNIEDFDMLEFYKGNEIIKRGYEASQIALQDFVSRYGNK